MVKGCLTTKENLQVSKMCKILIVLFAFISLAFASMKSPQCLTGIYHKDTPGPETAEYKACHAYKAKTCCTAEFTKQLAPTDIKKIGNFSWNNCGSISKKCQTFMKEVECFYQCSPNVGYWKGQFQGSFVGVPICSSFCDAWFDSCKDDMTCAKNWITGFDFNQLGENKCKLPKNCSSFADTFKDGMGLCNSMWGASFKYTVSRSPNDCMHLNASSPGEIKKNTLVAEKYHSIDSGSAKISVFLSNVVLFLVVWNIFV